MSALISIFLMSCLPGLIVALVVWRWAIARKLIREERACLVAFTIGVLCSPGIYVGGPGIAIVMPSLFVAFTDQGTVRQRWGIFVVSTMATTAIALIAYLLISKPNDPEEPPPED